MAERVAQHGAARQKKEVSRQHAGDGGKRGDHHGRQGEDQEFIHARGPGG